MSGLVVLAAILTALAVIGGAYVWLRPSRRSRDSVPRFVLFTAVVPLLILLAYARGDLELTAVVVINYMIALIPVGAWAALWWSRHDR